MLPWHSYAIKYISCFQKFGDHQLLKKHYAPYSCLKWNANKIIRPSEFHVKQSVPEYTMHPLDLPSGSER
jgi:hypothetical protein